MQCKHIYYGCALDETSIATLEAYKYDPIASASITMIKSRAVEGSNVHIPFELMELSSVFRNSDEIDDGAPGNSFSGFGDNATSAAGNWSRFAAQRSKISPTRRSARQPPPGSASTWDASEKIVLLNINDERVDSDLGKIDPKDYDSFMERFKNKRLCHYHYLVGYVLFPSEHLLPLLQRAENFTICLRASDSKDHSIHAKTRTLTPLA